MDRTQFRQLLSEHRDAVYGLSFYLVGSKEDAEDIVQDTFVSLWKHRDEMELEVVKWWLLRVCRNASLDLLRRRKVRRNARADRSGAVGRDRQGIETTEDVRRERTLDVSDLGSGALHTEQRIDTQRIVDAMQELREPYRSIVVLRETQDLTYDEIASTLDLSLSAVKVYLHRARRTLREMFEDRRHAEA